MRGLDGYKRAMETLQRGITAAEAEAERTEVLSIEVMDGKQKGAQCSDVTELFIRVSVETPKGEKTGLYYTQNMDEDPEEALRRAVDNAAFADGGKKEGFLSLDKLWKQPGKQGEDVPGASWETMCETASHLEEILRTENPDSQVLVRLIQTRETKGIVHVSREGNGQGDGRLTPYAVEGNILRYEAEVEIAEEEDGVPYFNAYSRSAACAEEMEPGFFLERIKKWRGMRLKPGSLEAGDYPAVLDCEVTANLFATAWQMFTGKNYLAASTPYADQMGALAMGRAVSLKNLPSIPEGGYRYAMDCEGCPVQPVTIADHGVFTGLLHTAATARAMGASPTGTAGRKALLSGNIHTDVVPVPANFRMERGEKSTETLLQEMGNGVYVFESFDVFHSINIASGEFHVPCKGIVVENGKKKAVVEGITINGTIQELLRDTEAVSCDMQVRPMDLLKSYTVSTPAMAVKKLKFTGSQS